MEKYRQLILTAFILFLGFSSRAQQNTVTAGGVSSGTGGSVTYSIGQIDFRSQTSANGNITQGLQQPYEIFSTGISTLERELNFSVFPNPTNGEITIQTTESLSNQTHFELFDGKGKRILKNRIFQQSSFLDLSEFASGSYFLTIRDNQQGIKNFTIIKN